MKKTISVLVLTMLVAYVLLPVQFYASATITPDTLTATLNPGESVSETKDVFLPGIIPKADVMFAFDCTGSMGGVIATAKAQATAIMTSLDTLITDAQYGVISHRDYQGYYSSYGYSNTYGASPDWPYRLEQAITSDHTAVQTAINGLSAGGGMDYPESYTRVMYESYADSSIGWRTGSKRILIMLNDDVPHDNDLNQGVPGAVGTWSTGGDPGRDAVMFTGDDLDLQTVLTNMATNSVTLLVVRYGSYVFNYWDHWAGLTGGDAYLSASAGDVPAAILALVMGTAAHVHKLTLKTEAGYEAWLTSVTPPEYTEIDIPPAGITKTFTITITVPAGTPPATYEFKIIADADGATYGEQQVTIKVPRPPIADFNYSPTDPGTGEDITFDASASTAPDGTITNYKWEFGDGNTTNTDDPIITHHYESPGTYDVTLTVTDSNGLEDSDSKQVKVTTHDVAVTEVTPDLNWVYQGKLCHAGVTVTVENQGEVPETFEVNVYADNDTAVIGDEFLIGSELVNGLLPTEQKTLTFLWDTTAVPPCHLYVITAVADTVPHETDTADNAMASTTTVKVRMYGDVNGDGIIDLKDYYRVSKAFGEWPGRPRWDMEADINNDDRIDLKDAYIVALNYGKTC